MTISRHWKSSSAQRNNIADFKYVFHAKTLRSNPILGRYRFQRLGDTNTAPRGFAAVRDEPESRPAFRPTFYPAATGLSCREVTKREKRR